MKIAIKSFIVLILIFFFSIVGTSGKVWRIGYYEGGTYHEFNDSMRTLIKSLMDLGLMKKKSLPIFDLNSPIPYPYCKWLSENMESDVFSISMDDCYTADWKKEKRIVVREELIKKLKNGEIDLMIAMGTWAGQDLANYKHSVPTVVMSTSDPVKAGIIKSGRDSGYDHITARYDPKRYPRQIRMFHRITGFKNVGIVHLSTPEGRIYSALDDFYTIGKERNFEVTTCQVPQGASNEIQDAECRYCFNRILEKVDAVYITVLSCEERILPELVEMINSYNIPSFALTSSKYVKAGVLMSISSDAGYESQGAYNAQKIQQIINGASPRSLNQIFEDPLFIAVNLDTAEKIGFEIPEGIMRIASEIYGEKDEEIKN